MNWSDFKVMVRRSQLWDEDETTTKWPDTKIWDVFGWAQREFAAHTAKLSTYSIVDGSAKVPGPGTWDFSVEKDFPLPTDVLEMIDLSGIVYTVTATATTPDPSYYDPMFYSRNLSPYAVNDYGYWTDATTLHLSVAPGAGKTLWLRYFAYWPEPATADDDTFVLAVPLWAIGALAYLTAAHCLTGPGNRSANIRQWNEKQDSGKPQDNALTEQAIYLTRTYEQMINRFARQDRANFFRVTG